ncbi:MAG: DUF3048 domain-containing protein [Oscillospiraceae bacterium]|nr:DUF3048 domain-containing protein [Oscillospiraceae bacterium]
MKRFAALLLACLLILSLAACAGKEEEPPVTPTPSASETPAPSEKPSPAPAPEPSPSAEPEPEPSPSPEPEPEPEPTVTNRFTGLPVEEDTSLKRPFAVIFNNISKAVPQTGISGADVILEVQAEGGITRIVAVFSDLDVIDALGSIRSMRPYFIDFTKCLDPIYIHAGGSDDAYIKIKSEGVTNVDGVNGSGVDSVFYRDSWRRSNMGYEHSLMAKTSALPAYIEKKGIKTELPEEKGFGFAFGESSLKGGTAETIKVSLSNSKTTSFAYSADDGLYRISQYGGKMTDSVTGEQLAVANLVVLQTTLKAYDSYGRMNVTSTGTGSGYAFTQGAYEKITWSRDSTSKPFTLKTESGEALLLTPGKTYVCIAPTDGNVAIS